MYSHSANSYEPVRYDIFGDEDGMAGTLGRVEEFDNSNDDWPQYVGHFFAANGIDAAEKKRAVLLSVVGASTYKTLRNLVSPKKPGEKDLRRASCRAHQTLQARAV
jgi:hypothetical protein